MNKILIFLVIFIAGCSTVATQSEDRNTLTIKGKGSAKFANGATIEGGTYFPNFPDIEIDK